MNEVITITVKEIGWLCFSLGIVAVIIFLVKTTMDERKQERAFKNKILVLNKKIRSL